MWLYVLQGDTIKVECTYDSTNKQNITYVSIK
jgi:hypothetical protein